MTGKQFWWGDPIPSEWVEIGQWGSGTAMQRGGLRVIVDCTEKSDGKMWLHVSYSREKWPPTHADTLIVRDAFIGPWRFAYAVFPTADRYVNIHPNCLHLWARLDGSAVLPHFDEELPGIGRSI